MEWDEGDDDVLVKMLYGGAETKIVRSAVEEEMIRFVDMTEMTDMEMLVVVSQPILDRVARHGSTAIFLTALQLVVLQLVDAKLRRDT